MSAKVPLIALTPDHDEDPGQPTEAHYLVRSNYADAIRESGGIPVILPYDMAAIPRYVDCFDGFLITGGTPDVTVKPLRTKFELSLIEAALAAQRPLLGICNGMQMIGWHLGGTLIQSIPLEVEAAQEHLPFDVPDRIAHDLQVQAGTRLAGLAQNSVAQVNSLHRQAISGSGRFVISAVAPDGVVEAIEGQTEGYCLAVQWHPEYRLTALDRSIMDDFVHACTGTSVDHQPGTGRVQP